MNTVRVITLLAMAVLTASCEKKEAFEIDGADYLIFGRYYGECLGEGCVEIYKLTATTLFEDTTDGYAGIGPLNFVELTSQQFSDVQGLSDAFPLELLDAGVATLGCPDCADQGGLYIQISDNGNLSSWNIDQQLSAVPSYMHSFMDEVNAKITLVNE
jgi:hypothetical protein